MQTPERFQFTPEQYRLLQANQAVLWFKAQCASKGSEIAAADRLIESDPRGVFSDVWRKLPEYFSLGGGLNTRFSMKAGVNPGTTLEPGWAAPLSPIRPFLDAFVALARPGSLVGKLQALAAARTIPFHMSIPVVTAGATFKWIPQGGPTPVGNPQLTSASLPVLKSGGLLVVSSELVKVGTPVATALLRAELIRGLSRHLDQALTDHTNAGVTGESPASITNAAPSIGSAGSSQANLETDFQNLIATFLATNPDAESIAIIMSPAIAVAAARATGWQGLSLTGGNLWGIPVLTSTAVGSRVIVLDPSALLVADEDGIDVSMSTEGTVEMESAPTSPPTASTVTVSLWTHNLAAVKVIRFINWRMARANAVLYTNVSYT